LNFTVVGSSAAIALFLFAAALLFLVLFALLLSLFAEELSLVERQCCPEWIDSLPILPIPYQYCICSLLSIDSLVQVDCLALDVY